MKKKYYILLSVILFLFTFVNLFFINHKQSFSNFNISFFNTDEDRLINDYLAENTADVENLTYKISYYDNYKTILLKNKDNYDSLYFNNNKLVSENEFFTDDFYDYLLDEFLNVYDINIKNADELHYLLNNDEVTVIYYNGKEYTLKFKYNSISNYLKLKPFDIRRNTKYVAFTFDDGPSSHTDELLNILKKNYANATFFLVGSSISNYPNTVTKMDKMGFEIANHTEDHSDLTNLSCDVMKKNINKVNIKTDKLISKTPNLLRPPYGAFNNKVRKCLNKPFIFWSLDTRDWETRDKKSVKNNVLKNVKDGDIILFHDLYKSTVDAVSEIIPVLYERGYQILSVSELADIKNTNLENGEIYRYIR